jgi:hypothetical protein
MATTLNVPVQLIAAGYGQDPVALMASMNDEEKQEFSAYMAATAASTSEIDYAQNALELFFEQRRRTRTYVITCSLMAAALGGLMGFYVGKPAKGK